MSKIHKPWLTLEDLYAFFGGGALDVLPHAAEHEVGGSDLLAFADIPGFGDWLDQAVKQTSNVSFGTLGCGVLTAASGSRIQRAVGDCGFYIETYDVDATDYSQLQLRRSHHDTINTIAETQDNDYLGLITFLGVNSGSAWGAGVRIEAIQNGNAGASYVPTDLYLYTYSSTAKNTFQLVLHHDGGVGIGTETPADVLHVNSAATNAGILVKSLTDNARVRLDAPADEVTSFLMSIGDVNKVNFYRPATTEDLRLKMGASDYVTVTSAGNVGINNIAPDTTSPGLTIGGAISLAASHLNVRGNTASKYVQVIEQDSGTGWGLYIDTDSVAAGDPALRVHNLHEDIFTVESGGDVKIGAGSVGYNPKLYIYGDDGGVPNFTYLFVDASGGFNLTADQYITINTAAGGNLYWDFGGSQFWRDIDAANAVRMTLVSNTGRLGIGEPDPDELLHVNGIVKADTFHLQAGVTPNLAWLSDVTFDDLEEGETIAYDQGDSMWVDAWGVEYDNPRLTWKMRTEFFKADPDTNDPWTGAPLVAGGGLSDSPGETNHPGVIRLNCGNALHSGYYFMTSITALIISGRERSEFVFKTAPVLTDKYIRLGFQDSTTEAAPTDGIFLNIAENVLTGKTYRAGANSTTGVPYNLAAGTWYRGTLSVNDDIDLVTFNLYSAAGNLLWGPQTLAANIPTATLGHGVLAYIDDINLAGPVIYIDMMVASQAGFITR